MFSIPQWSRIAIPILGVPGLVFAFSMSPRIMWAQEPGHSPAASDQRSSSEQPQDFWTRDKLTGDWGGLRQALEQKGVTVSLSYQGEVLDNIAGGIRRGSVYEHEILGQVEADLEKLLQWSGATFHISAYDYAGAGLTKGFVGSLVTVSGIEAPPPSIRLFTLWLEQKLLGDKLAVKAGVLALDEEQFALTVPSSLFVGATFGYPDGLAVNLPAGGPTYPLSAPAVLLEANPVPIVQLHAAVFSGDPAGHLGATFPLESTPSGTVISFSGGALIAAEAILTPEPKQDGLATRFRLGGWYHTGNRFADQHFASNGLPLADSASTGLPRNDTGDWAVYGTGEAMLYRVPGTKDQGLAAFARVAGLPAAQNVVSINADGGLTYKGLLPRRPEDTVGIAVAYLGISPAARAQDLDTRRFGDNSNFPIRSYEVQLEITYRAQLTPWWQVQPDFQYVFNPGGGILDPEKPGSRLKNAVILGLRTAIKF